MRSALLRVRSMALGAASLVCGAMAVQAEDAPVLGWDRLAGFDFVAPAYADGQVEAEVVAQSRAQIPAEIAAFDGRRAVLTGFMLPVRMEAGKVVEFLLVSDPMVCCYGAVPKVNEWVTVRLATPMEPEMDVPLAVVGTLKVGPVLDHGYLTTIYALEAAARARQPER